MPCFIVQFPLNLEPWQENCLFSRFEIARQIYNSLITKTQKRYKEMVKTKQYRNLITSLSGNKEHDKPIWQQINQIRRDFNFTEYDFTKDVKLMQHHFKQSIDAFTAQKIASRVWTAYEKLFYDNGKAIHYKKYGTMDSLQGKSNKTGIKYRNGFIFWNGLKLTVVINPKNKYEAEALTHDIKYCALVKQWVRGRNKYYVQITFDGIPPQKHSIGKGDVGIDIGVSTIAVSSEKEVFFKELADKVQNIEDHKRRILRKLDRSRRATNPDNFNADGTIKKPKDGKSLEWVKSKNYIKLQFKLKELYRKQVAVRKYQHNCLANYMVSLGDNIYVETMKFNALAKRAKEGKTNSKGKNLSKKRFGKTIASRAPAMLLEMIDKKLKYFGRYLIKIDTASAKASQFNHIDESYIKKKLSQRWNNINGYKIQRDLYSAFLIMNTDSSLKTFDINKCNNRFDNFIKLHDSEIKKLEKLKKQSGHKFLSCMGI